MSDQYITNTDTVYFHFASNDTSGSGGDGASAAVDVRECGALASAASITTGVTVSLLSDASYPAGCYEIAIDTTTGYSADKTYAVFCTLLVDSQNPTGFVGRFHTKDIQATLDSETVTLASTTHTGAVIPTVTTVTNDVGVNEWNGTALGTTNPLPNAAAGAAGGLPTDSTGKTSFNDITAAAAADAVWDEVQSGHVSVGSFGEIATEIANILVDTNELQTDDIPTLIAALPTAAANADAVWDEVQSGHVGVGTFGEMATEVASILDDTDLIDDGTSGLAKIATDVANILVDTNELQTDDVPTLIAALPTAAANADAVWDEAQSGHVGVGTFGEIATEVASILDDTDLIDDGTSGLAKIATDVAAILVDTNEMQGDLTNSGRLDTIFDSILSLLDDARTEPGQGAPAVNPDAMTKIDYLYKAWRNKTMQSATEYKLYDDAGTTVDQKATVSDDGTDFTRGEIGTGP